jgi:GTP cyclohydrolase II
MADGSLTCLMGDAQEVAVERALAEMRSGRPVLLCDAGARLLTMGAESIDDTALTTFKATGEARLVLSPSRLRLLGHDCIEPGMLTLGTMSAARINDIVYHTGIHLDGQSPQAAGDIEKGALELVRLAFLLPAAIVVPLGDSAAADACGVVRVPLSAINHYREIVLSSPRIVARAPVPLEDVGETEFIVFRGGEGMRDQIAVIIGHPDPAAPVYVRMHSACLTGDLFGSLKCDCGDQLRGTVRYMAQLGGGILLYLDQEGRGNGIANKIRAYKLQHAGYDTFDADEILGFDLDQRRFDFAAAMIKELGHTSVRLLTNNPQKVLALQEVGLEVVSSHPVKGRLTLQNAGYLAAKRDRAGHTFEQDLEAESCCATKPVSVGVPKDKAS